MTWSVSGGTGGDMGVLVVAWEYGYTRVDIGVLGCVIMGTWGDMGVWGVT